MPDGVTGNVQCPRCRTLFPVIEKPIPKPAASKRSTKSSDTPTLPPEPVHEIRDLDADRVGNESSFPESPHQPVPAQPANEDLDLPPEHVNEASDLPPEPWYEKPDSEDEEETPPPPPAVTPRPVTAQQPRPATVEQPKPEPKAKPKRKIVVIEEDEDEEPVVVASARPKAEPKDEEPAEVEEAMVIVRKRVQVVDGEPVSPPKTRARRVRADDDDDDEPDEWRPKIRSSRGHGKARIGMLLLTIANWMYVSIYALFTLGLFLGLMGVLFASDSPTYQAGPGSRSASTGRSFDGESLVNTISLLTGLLGLGNWVISLVGFSFCIAGPRRTTVSAITATVIAGVHLLLIAIAYGLFANRLTGLGLDKRDSTSLLFFSTTVPFLNGFLPMLFYASRSITGEVLVLMIVGVVEIARLICSLILTRNLAGEAKNYSAAERAQLGVVAAPIVLGVGLFISLLVSVLLREAEFKSPKTNLGILIGTMFLLCLAYTVMLLPAALAAGGTQAWLARKRR
jgi:hypothetical protein